MNLDKILSTFCHHKPTRLLEFFDGHSLLCARCSGIYLGFLAGVLFLLFFRQTISYTSSRKSIIIPALFIVLLPLEVAAEAFLGFQPGNFVRYFSGTSFGVGFSVFIGVFWMLDSTTKVKLNQVGAFKISAGLLSTFVVASCSSLLLFWDPAFNFAVISGLALAYTSVNFLIAKMLLEIKSTVLCIVFSVLLTLGEWGALFYLNNYVKPLQSLL